MDKKFDKPVNTALLKESAIVSIDLNEIRKCLDQGADVNFADRNNKTIVCWAAFNENKELVSLLLERNADPDITAIYLGRTPLEIA